MKVSCSCKGRKYFANLYVPEFTGDRIGLNFRKLLTKGLQISDSLCIIPCRESLGDIGVHINS